MIPMAVRLDTWRVDQYLPPPRVKTNTKECKKAIISNKTLALIVWHRWTLISVATSLTLIHLNLSEYAIGQEVGGNPVGTANILGALQLVIKAHELTIVASLYQIARQWIQGCLMDVKRGTVLGLVGAERSLAVPSFLISPEFRAAVQNVFAGDFRGCALAVFLFTGCILSSLAGPASGALMIPRVGWFYEKELSYLNMPSEEYPNILIDPRLGRGELIFRNQNIVFDSSVVKNVMGGLDYWQQFYSEQTSLGVVRVQNTVHEFTDISGRRYTNSSTTWGRYLDGDWDTGTTVSAVMSVGIDRIRRVLHHEKSWSTETKRLASDTESNTYVKDLNSWLARKYVTNAKSMHAHVQCRSRPRESCDRSSIAINYTHWCYTSGTHDGPLATVRSSQDLLLLDSKGNGEFPRAVYIGDGPRGTNQYSKYADSFYFIIDEGYDPPEDFENHADLLYSLNITVCTVSIELKSAVVSSLNIQFSPQFADYANYLSHSDGAQEAPRTLLFHENWFDYIHLWEQHVVTDGTPENVTVSGNITYSPRNMSKPTHNPTMLRYAKIFLDTRMVPVNDSGKNGGRGHVEAATLEIVVGGACVQLMSFMNPTDSQYTVASWITLPDSLMPEPRQHFPHTIDYIIKVENQGYGFRLSSRTGILGMVVLVTHATIAVLGSLWLLCWERRVIAAWDTIPDYLALGIGSTVTGRGLENTCAGIMTTQTLGARVVVGETSSQHLEVSLLAESTKIKGIGDRYGEKYGFRAPVARQKERLE